MAGMFIAGALSLSSPTQAQNSPTAVVTQRYDNLRSGVNSNESILDTTNVGSAEFGRLFSRIVLGINPIPYSQPLYVPGLTIQGAVRNVVYVATEGNYIYAYDADNPLAPTLWTANLTPANGSVTVASDLGILGTPVIDTNTNTIYTVSKTVEGPINRPASYVFRLHALDILSGQEKPNSPVVINFSVPGKGAASIRGVLSLNPMLQDAKTALLLTQGKVLFGFGAGVAETNMNYHGYVMAYDATTLARVAVWCTTPNGMQGGIWGSGNSMISDDKGNVWVATGNGTVNPPTNDLGMSLVRLKLTDTSLEAVDYFTPNNYATENEFDEDLGVTGPMMLPGSQYLVQGGKATTLYLLDPFNLGGLGTTNDANAAQAIPSGNGEMHGLPIAYVGPDGTTLYYMLSKDNLRSYNLLANGLVDLSSGVQNDFLGNGQGGYMTISTQGTTSGTGILWCYHPTAHQIASGYQTAVLEAYDASAFNLLWTSNQNMARDNCDGYAKWSYPTVANGKVYLGSGTGELVVYGLLNSGVPAVPTGLKATLKGSSITLSWSSVPGAVAYNVRKSPIQGGPYNIQLFDYTATSGSVGFKSTGSNTYNYYVVSAVNANGESANSVELAYSPWPAPPVISASSVKGVPTITWAAAAQASSYSVMRGTQSGGPYTTLASGLTALSYTDSSVAANTKYYYVLTSTNSYGVSANSNEVTN